MSGLITINLWRYSIQPCLWAFLEEFVLQEASTELSTGDPPTHSTRDIISNPWMLPDRQNHHSIRREASHHISNAYYVVLLRVFFRPAFHGSASYLGGHFYQTCLASRNIGARRWIYPRIKRHTCWRCLSSSDENSNGNSSPVAPYKPLNSVNTKHSLLQSTFFIFQYYLVLST